MKWSSLIIAFFVFFHLIATSARADVVTYNTPVAASGAPDFSVKADGKGVFVNHARIAGYAIFSCDGPVAMEVTWMGTIDSVVVRPLRLGIKPVVEGHKITFTLPKPASVSVEINGNIRRPLFIFANPLESNPPQRRDSNVIYYHAGRIHDAGLVELKSGDTVYIAGGAIVRGAFIAEDANDITIMGRGILDGSSYHKGERRMIELLRCNNISIRDIVIFNSGHWTVPLKQCDTVDIANLKIVSWRDWDDGIDVCGSSNVTISRSFIRTKDDCVAIKSVHYPWMAGDGMGNVRNVTVQDSVLWNGIWGNALEIGFETRAQSIRDIVFRNNDLIHVEGSEGTFTIHNGDRANVSHVLYENIRVEEVEGYLIDFKILESRYSKDTDRGRIANIRFNNIEVVGDVFPPSLMHGFDAAHGIDGVTISNLRIQGKAISSEAQLKLDMNEFVKGVSFVGLPQATGTAMAQTSPVEALATGPKFHWFGYYDKLQFDPSHRYVLGMAVDFEHRSPTKNDVIKVGMIDLKDGNRWIELGESRSWGWQQGCMLQWIPGSDSKVIWNDRRGDGFVSIVKDIRTGEQRTLSRPVYALSPDGKYAIGTDFARIQNYRKGYGYPGGKDPHKHQNAPEASGIYRLNLETGQSKLILSYKEISKLPNAGEDISEKWHYFNHLLVSPDSQRFIFLNRWREAPIPDEVLSNPEAYNKIRGRYTTRMFTAGMDGQEVFLLDPSGRTSHFIWKDPEHVTAWTRPEGKSSGFWEFKDRTTQIRQIGQGVMTRNGHNTYLPGTHNDWILNDTYPQGDRREQIPYLYQVSTGKKIELGRFHEPKEYTGEWRCDTHPRFSCDGKLICIDSTHEGNGRQMYLIDIHALEIW